jgi:hypothetical protein
MALAAGVSEFAWSPDSRLLGYVASGNLWLAEGSGSAVMVAEGGISSPLVRPDASAVAFTRSGDVSLYYRLATAILTIKVQAPDGAGVKGRARVVTADGLTAFDGTVAAGTRVLHLPTGSYTVRACSGATYLGSRPSPWRPTARYPSRCPRARPPGRTRGGRRPGQPSTNPSPSLPRSPGATSRIPAGPRPSPPRRTFPRAGTP